MKANEKKMVAVKSLETLDGDYEVETSTEDIRVFDTDPAYLTYKEGVTINLGNYESSRVDYGLTIPCNPEEIEVTTTEALIKVKAVLKERVATIKGLV